jgi:hypothetical protein
MLASTVLRFAATISCQGFACCRKKGGMKAAAVSKLMSRVVRQVTKITKLILLQMLRGMLSTVIKAELYHNGFVVEFLAA